MKKLILFLFLVGCTVDMDHHFPEGKDIDIKVGLDDPCITCFPECSLAYENGYYCADRLGRECTNCMVGCIGGRDLVCSADGPHCTNEGPTGNIEVPVVCVAK